jgi:hypothetical protein
MQTPVSFLIEFSIQYKGIINPLSFTKNENLMRVNFETSLEIGGLCMKQSSK